MSLISVNNLSFSYEGSYTEVFTDTSFQIDTDWKLGFIGRNGRGKTTFLKLLLGEYPYQGSISASVSFEYFPYQVADEERMVLEIAQEIAPGAEDWEFIKELSLLQVDASVLYRSFSTLSQGERTKVLLTSLFLRTNSFLLIDEPTNHLDALGRDLLAAYLKKKKGFILVSHDRRFLDEVVDHILSINKQSITVMKGNYSVFAGEKAAKDQFELNQNEKIKREIKQMESAAKRTKAWSDDVEKSKKGEGAKVAGLRPDRGFIGHKAAKMMKRTKTMERRIEDAITKKGELLKELESQEPLEMRPLTFPKEILVTMTDVSLSYEDKVVLEDFSLQVKRGQRINLAGGNGSGKSSVLKAILGEVKPGKGQVALASGLVISYVSQDTRELSGTLKELAEKNGVEVSLLVTVLRKLDLGREQIEIPVENYSEGQKKKVLLALSLCTPAHLYIWDEPLNYIDVISREQIESVLLEREPTIIFVEHDRWFCDKIATEKVVLGNGKE